MENNEHLFFDIENMRDIRNILGVLLNFDIKWNIFVLGFYHEYNIKDKT